MLPARVQAVLLARVAACVTGLCGGLCYWPVWRPVLLAHGVAACIASLVVTGVPGPCDGRVAGWCEGVIRKP